MDQQFAKIKDLLKSIESLIGEVESEVTGPDNECATEIGDLPFRVMHLTQNPYNQLVENEEAEYKALMQENERLKARLLLIESGNDANVTMRIDEAVNNAHQVEMLTQRVEEYKNREEKILTSLKKTAGEFREACFSLIGYRVDALKDNIYRLSHRYANSDDEKLYFEVKRNGTIVLLQNDYSNRHSYHRTTYIDKGDSLPAFLAAITLDLFKTSTAMNATSMNATQAMDISMSTTILPNPKYHAK